MGKVRNSSFKIESVFDTQVGGGQDKLAWTAYPPPLQLSIQNNATEKTAEYDLNNVYNGYIITFR